MKQTFTRTTFHKDLTECIFELDIHEGLKWEDENEITVEYRNVTSWDIISGGKEAEEIESLTDQSGIDECHEYLVLHFENGDTSTFRNSHVDMFIK